MKTFSLFSSILFFCILSIEAPGQHFVKDINPASVGDGSFPGPKTTLREEFFFWAYARNEGFRLWKSDGSPTGTAQLGNADLSSLYLAKQEIVNIHDILYFAADDKIHGNELWRSDGSEDGTYMVADLVPGAAGSNPARFMEINGEIFFVANHALWKITTGEQVEKIRDVVPHSLLRYNGIAIFTIHNGVYGMELWKSDGTESGTQEVKDINPSGPSDIFGLVVYDNSVYFTVYDGMTVHELWKTNGEAGGTERTLDINDLEISKVMPQPANIIHDPFVFHGNLYFWVAYGDMYAKNYQEVLFKSDGSKDGTVAFDRCPDAFCFVEDYKVFGNNLFVSFNDSLSSWIERFDGNTFSTYYYLSGGFIDEMEYLHNGNLYFEASPGARADTGLWASDGKSAMALGNALFPSDFHLVDDVLVFVAEDKQRGRELWRTDGTPSGTIMLEINLSLLANNGSNPNNFVKIGNTLYFSAYDPSHGMELWKYNPAESLFAIEVVSFDQGPLRDGRKEIADIRSDPRMALGQPQENDTYNFVSLGFGGQITLKLGARVYDDGTAAPEIMVVETSYGRAGQMCYENGFRQYPEMALVEVSYNSQDWRSLPNSYCRTSFLDIGPAIEKGVPYVEYIRITDNSNKEWFDNTADGFDLDGIIIGREEVAAAIDRLNDARISGRLLFDPDFFNRAPNEEQVWKIVLYPSPADDWFIAEMFSENVGICQMKIFDLMGRKILETSISARSGMNKVTINTSTIPHGQYVLQMTMNGESLTRKFVKR